MEDKQWLLCTDHGRMATSRNIGLKVCSETCMCVAAGFDSCRNYELLRWGCHRCLKCRHIFAFRDGKAPRLLPVHTDRCMGTVTLSREYRPARPFKVDTRWH